MGRALQLVGKKFGMLKVISKLPSFEGRTRWKLKCDCGKLHSSEGRYLTFGKLKSCGCAEPKLTSHRLSLTPEYNSWRAMICRCFSKAHGAFYRYGGAGIKPCKWLLASPINLITLLGNRPYGYTLERIKNKKGYTCGQCEDCRKNRWGLNVKWATRKEQMRNTKLNVILKFRGESLCVSEWAERTGLTYASISQRIRNLGWSVKKALTTPVRPSGRWNKIGTS